MSQDSPHSPRLPSPTPLHDFRPLIHAMSPWTPPLFQALWIHSSGRLPVRKTWTGLAVDIDYSDALFTCVTLCFLERIYALTFSIEPHNVAHGHVRVYVCRHCRIVYCIRVARRSRHTGTVFLFLSFSLSKSPVFWSNLIRYQYTWALVLVSIDGEIYPGNYGYFITGIQ